MGRNIQRYCQAWKLRQQGKKLREIAQIMGLKSGEWPRIMINYFNFRLNNKFRPLPKDIHLLIKK